MDREAKEYQAPSLQRPAVPIYQELRVEIMQGEDRKKAGQREEEGPALKGLHHRAKHRDPQDPPSPEEVVTELQRRKEAEGRKWVPKKEPAREPGTDRGSRKPSREEFRNTSNKTCKGVEPGRRFKTKRGQSHPPAPRPDTRDGRPGHRAHNLAEDRPNPQVHKPRAFQAHGVEDHTAYRQPRYQRETARKTSDGSSLRSAGNDPLVKRGKEAEIQASEPMDVEAGRDEPSLVIKDHPKEALHHAAQKGTETADKDSDSEKKGQEQSGM